MAEVAGLTIGAVGLVALLQTCVETCEYIEAGKNLVDEVKLATVKVQLLRIRLDQWAAALRIESFRDREVEETLSGRWPTDHDAILRCLSQISDLLARVVLLSGRYQCDQDPTAPKRAATTHHVAHRSPIGAAACGDDDYIKPSLSLFEGFTACGSTSAYTLRKRFSWAIKDRKKFERWIVDLNFLVTCLEELGIGKPVVMNRHSHSTEASRKGNKEQCKHTNSRHERKKHKEKLSPVLSDDVEEKALVKKDKHIQRYSPDRADTFSSSTSTASASSSEASNGAKGHHHTYEPARIDQSQLLEGNIGKVNREPGQTGHYYGGPIATNNSTVVRGDIDDVSFQVLVATWTKPRGA